MISKGIFNLWAKKDWGNMVKSFFLKIFITLIFSFTGYLTFAAEGDTYSFSWLDSDKEVFVLQNRKYRKRDKLYINAGVGTTTSGGFTDAKFIQARGGYFFLEEWGIEGLFVKHNGEENETFDSIQERVFPYYRLVNGYKGLMLLWSPFYAKINTFNQVIYLDWMFGLGFVSVEDEHNAAAFRASKSRNSGSGSVDRNDYPNELESNSGLVWDIALKIFLSKNWEVRTDLTVIHYQATGFEDTKEWNDSWDLGFSLGYSF